MKRALRFPMTAIAATLAVAGSATVQAQVSDDVVRIGIMGDMNGPYAANGGPGSVVAARMAIEDFGGKVLGKPIELVVADETAAQFAATVRSDLTLWQGLAKKANLKID